MRIATYNLRYDSQPDRISVRESIEALPNPLERPRFLGRSGEVPWSTRRLKVAQQLLQEEPNLIAFQESLVRQVYDLAELLGDDWAWVGVGRDDGKQAGEFCPIFYKKSDLTLVHHESFWLSDKPFEPSRYPDAGSFRVCEVARFKTSTKTFTILNSHLDDRSDAQRRLAASMLLARARYEAHTTSGPVFITGDFNSASHGYDSGAYQIVTGVVPPVPINETFAEKYKVPTRGDEKDAFVGVDLKAETPRMRVSGDFATFTGFNRPGDPSVYTRIDFVFGGSNGGWTADAYKVGTSLTDDGVLASDHRPVYADVTI
ncbi:Endonuclease/exonuclease/phosphatase [Fomitopsis serialis]|uniref:Endonuclease/exonuclease/phosphatase n=1 Tax=Fomitopsis serialis TaxID=139415 RepID=UPI00200723C0|nr:Endonuclease/exonuclease/phosphatase [Neoantrodia serialis]KAH9931583.1 Endonuclease/exonuclease/phosphatase [Neoantrodia serialis]